MASRTAQGIYVILVNHSFIVIFLDFSVEGGKVHWGYPYVKHQPVRQGQTTTPGTTCPSICQTSSSTLERRIF